MHLSIWTQCLKIKETLNNCTKGNQKGNIIGEQISFLLKHSLQFLPQISNRYEYNDTP